MTELTRDANRLVRIYRKIREAKEENTAIWKAKDDEYKLQMMEIEKLLLNLMEEQNSEGLRTESGTVSRQVKQTFWSSDWDSFKKFCAAEVEAGNLDVLDLYEHRIAQRNMAEFVKQYPTKVPPGLQMDRRYAVVVTKPRNKPDNME